MREPPTVGRPHRSAAGRRVMPSPPFEA